MSSHVLISERAGDVWAFSGAKIAYALDLTRDRGFADLTPDERLAHAVEQQRAWLEAVLAPGLIIDLRYIRDPDSKADGGFDCVVLVRAHGNSRSDATAAITRAQTRLMTTVGHVAVEELNEQDLRSAVNPFVPGAQGRANIRKRADTGVPNRPDADVPMYWAVAPLRASARSWGPLFAAIASYPHRLAISVALSPWPDSSALAPALDKVATYYGVLAVETEGEATGLYSRVQKLHADAFAVDAQKVFSDVARRYRSRVHAMDIAIASPDPLDEGLLSLLASTISPPDAPHEGMALTGPLASSTAEIMKPRADEISDFDAAFAGVGVRMAPPGDIPERFRSVAAVSYLVDTREATAAFRLPIAESGSISGFDVRSGDFGVETAARRRTSERSLELGPQVVHGRARQAITIDVDDLTMHAFVVGTTGSGKTSTTLGILDALWRQWQTPWLVIEPVNTTGDDYRFFMDRPGFEELLILTAGDDEIAPLRMNLFEIEEGVTVGEHLSALLSIFDSAFGLWDPLPAIYRRALEQVYFEAGFALTDRSSGQRWPSLADFAREMRIVTDGLEYSGEVRSNIIAASIVRVEQLATGPLRSIFDTTRSTPLGLLLDRPAVVELGKVGASNEQEAAFVIAALLSRIAEHRRARQPSRTLRHVIVVEEAHKLLRAPMPQSGDVSKGDASAAASRMFADLLAEIRKYGQAIIVADQDPAKLVPDAYKNTNLKIMHRLPAEDDRRLVGGTMRFDDDHRDQAAALERFTAFVHAEGYDRPGLVRFTNIREGSNSDLPSDADVRLRFEALTGGWFGRAEWLAPYEECSGCTSVCTARAWAHSRANQRAHRKQFRELAIKRQGLAGSDADAVVTEMVEWGIHVATGSAVDARCLIMHSARTVYDSDVDRFMERIDGAFLQQRRGAAGP